MALYGKTSTKQAKYEAVSAPFQQVRGVKWNYMRKHISNPYMGSSTGRDLIMSQLNQLLLTAKGERVMLPDFGTSIKNLLFEPLSSELVALAAEEVESAINKYIPSINLLKLNISKNENMYGFGLPGLQVYLLVSLKASSEVLNIKVKI